MSMRQCGTLTQGMLAPWMVAVSCGERQGLANTLQWRFDVAKGTG